MKGEDGKIKDDSIFKYTSPKAVDDEKDKITMTFDTKGKTFIKMSQNKDNSFTMSVNRSGLDEKSQSILLQVKLKDFKNPDGVLKILMLNVKYSD